MARLNPGDRVSCPIKDCSIVVVHCDYDEIKIFEVLAPGEYGYYLFVPIYWYIKNTININPYVLKQYEIDPRFLGEEMIHVHENMICEMVQEIDGMSCGICKNFCPMAAANQENGTFICFSCRENPYH